jgi:hypothetical protein
MATSPAGSRPRRAESVEWLGALPRHRVRRELADPDVFFLSSVDDPMPLSVVEAVQQRLRVVTFDKVGSRELLGGVRGYRSFGEYTPEAAFTALDEVLREQVSEEDYQESRTCSTSPRSPLGCPPP